MKKIGILRLHGSTRGGLEDDLLSVPLGGHVHLVGEHGEVEEVLRPVDGILAAVVVVPGGVPRDVVPRRGHPYPVAPHVGGGGRLGVLFGEEAVVHVGEVLRGVHVD